MQNDDSDSSMINDIVESSTSNVDGAVEIHIYIIDDIDGAFSMLGLKFWTLKRLV